MTQTMKPLRSKIHTLALVALCLALTGLGWAALHRVHELEKMAEETERDLEHFAVAPAAVRMQNHPARGAAPHAEPIATEALSNASSPHEPGT